MPVQGTGLPKGFIGHDRYRTGKIQATHLRVEYGNSEKLVREFADEFQRKSLGFTPENEAILRVKRCFQIGDFRSLREEVESCRLESTQELLQ
jgi:hypothetical protein